MLPKVEGRKTAETGTIVCKNFRLMKKLGTGAFGDIYLAVNIHKQTEKLAAKLQQTSARHPQLGYEAKLYQLLNKEPNKGFPKMHAYCMNGNHNVMLLDLLGRNLEELLQEQGKTLSLKTVVMLGLQILDRIEYLHSSHFLHRDIKPENFLMGTGDDAHRLYMIDLGLAKKYIREGKHNPYRDGQDLLGTICYVSVNTHLGIQQSRRDDLESIGYVLVYLLRGTLPWYALKSRNAKQKHKMIMERKMAITPQQLTQGFPQEFAAFIRYAKELKFEETPDYNYLRGLLENIRIRQGLELDWNYDWSKVTTKETSTVKIGIRPPRILNSPDDRTTKKQSRGRRQTGNSMDIERSTDSKHKMDMNFGSSNKNRFRAVMHQNMNGSGIIPDQKSPNNQEKDSLDSKMAIEKD